MKICSNCLSLNGQPYEARPHDDLDLQCVAGPIRASGPTMETYRCRGCGTWMRRHTSKSEFADQWQATVRTPINVNGYLVDGEAFVSDGSELFDATYEIRLVDASGNARIVHSPGVVSKGHKTHYEALADALELGVAHAKGLPPG